MVTASLFLTPVTDVQSYRANVFAELEVVTSSKEIMLTVQYTLVAVLGQLSGSFLSLFLFNFIIVHATMLILKKLNYCLAKVLFKH